MAPKKKPWLHCSVCNCRFHADSQKEHASQCSDFVKVPSAKSILEYFVALKPISKAVDFGPVQKMYAIRMHPDTMEALDIGDCDHLEVGAQFVCEVLHDREVPKNCFQLFEPTFKTHIDSGNKLQKISIIGMVRKASCIKLFVRPVITIRRKDLLVIFLKNSLDDVCLRKDFTFNTAFLQWEILVTVTSIDIASDVEGEASSDGEWLTVDSRTTTVEVDLEGERKDLSDIFSARKKVNFNDLGGYEAEKRRLLELFRQSRKGDRPSSCLIYGRRGTGKSCFGNAIGSISPSVSLHSVGVFEAIELSSNKKVGILKAVNRMVNRDKMERSMFFFDNLEATFRKDEAAHNPDKAHQLAEALKFLLKCPKVCLILGACIDIQDLPPDVLSLFEERIHLKTPSRSDRLEIFLERCRRWTQDELDPKEAARVTDICHGFVAKNMMLLSSRAELNTVRRQKVLLEGGLEARRMPTHEDLMEAYEYVKASVPDLHLHATVTSPVHWDDIIGYDDLKVQIRMAFEWPVTRAEQFKALGLTPQRGVLLYGPPGCCKTMVARAIATEFKMNFLAVRGSDLLSSLVGESEKNVNRLFAKARKNAPSLIFFDEIDSIATKRTGSSEGGTSGILSALLTEMDGLESMDGVAILAATNKPSDIDKALLRFKRLGQTIYVRLPCPETRRLLLQKQLAKMATSPDVDIDLLVEKTERYSGDELVKLCHQAGYKCLLEDINGLLETKHFLSVLEIREPVTSVESLEIFEDFEKTKD